MEDEEFLEGLDAPARILMEHALRAADKMLDEADLEPEIRKTLRPWLASAWVTGRHEGGMEARALLRDAMAELKPPTTHLRVVDGLHRTTKEEA
jgi:hypothetical protein